MNSQLAALAKDAFEEDRKVASGFLLTPRMNSQLAALAKDTSEEDQKVAGHSVAIR